MPIEGRYEPSPWEPVAEQVSMFESSGGKEGADIMGFPCIVLWTKGRKTGNVRKTPLIRVRYGDRYAVVASMGGAPKHPVWYHNLVAHREVSLQDGDQVVDFTAREVEGAEKAEWWRRATEVYAEYDEYQKKTEREIPLIVLDPA